jgi:hypothetical protein
MNICGAGDTHVIATNGLSRWTTCAGFAFAATATRCQTTQHSSATGEYVQGMQGCCHLYCHLFVENMHHFLQSCFNQEFVYHVIDVAQIDVKDPDHGKPLFLGLLKLACLLQRTEQLHAIVAVGV